MFPLNAIDVAWGSGGAKPASKLLKMSSKNATKNHNSEVFATWLRKRGEIKSMRSSPVQSHELVSLYGGNPIKWHKECVTWGSVGISTCRSTCLILRWYGMRLSFLKFIVLIFVYVERELFLKSRLVLQVSVKESLKRWLIFRSSWKRFWRDKAHWVTVLSASLANLAKYIKCHQNEVVQKQSFSFLKHFGTALYNWPNINLLKVE